MHRRVTGSVATRRDIALTRKNMAAPDRKIAVSVATLDARIGGLATRDDVRERWPIPKMGRNLYSGRTI